MGQLCGIMASNDASYRVATSSAATLSAVGPVICSFHCSACPGCSLSRNVLVFRASILLVNGTDTALVLVYSRPFCTIVKCKTKPPRSVSKIGISKRTGRPVVFNQRLSAIFWLRSYSHSTQPGWAFPSTKTAFWVGSPFALMVCTQSSVL